MNEFSEHRFRAPTRAILSPVDLNSFKESPLSKEIFDFVKICADSVAGKKISDFSSPEVETSIHPFILQFSHFMKFLRDLVEEIPPLQQPMRFGNKAFKIWHARLLEEVPLFLANNLPSELVEKGLVEELTPYLTTAFGNETRIDYGTGHELNIAIFFLLLFKIKIISQVDFPSCVLVGFVSYIQTMRVLQTRYVLEPAGSHGVWGLDDFHCLPFLWGASQLSNTHPGTRSSPPSHPSSSHSSSSSSILTTTTTTTTTSQSTEENTSKEEEDEKKERLEEELATTTTENNSATPSSSSSSSPSESSPSLSPMDIHNPSLLSHYASEYLYFENIQFIKQLKSSAPFSETSPMLYDISHLPDWSRITSGLLRLFQNEVLFKFPVVQHLLFGSIFQSTWMPAPVNMIHTAGGGGVGVVGGVGMVGGGGLSMGAGMSPLGGGRVDRRLEQLAKLGLLKPGQGGQGQGQGGPGQGQGGLEGGGNETERERANVNQIVSSSTLSLPSHSSPSGGSSAIYSLSPAPRPTSLSSTLSGSLSQPIRRSPSSSSSLTSSTPSNSP